MVHALFLYYYFFSYFLVTCKATQLQLYVLLSCRSVRMDLLLLSLWSSDYLIFSDACANMIRMWRDLSSIDPSSELDPSLLGLSPILLRCLRVT